MPILAADITGQNLNLTGVVTCTSIDTGAGTGGSIPSGGIIMWSGAVSAIPSGWVLCDGTNSTPDLRDRFVIGATTDGSDNTFPGLSVNQSGGSADAIVVSHTHTITDPQHNHSYSDSTNDGTGGGQGGGGANTGTTTLSKTTGNQSTGISIDSSGSSGTNANLPPYYALAFIMKT